jgi:DHA1 family tetracycline resistance protein-like MFS transporter
LRMPTVGALVSMYFLVIFGFANFEGTLSMFTKDAFHMNERANFLVFAFIGFVLMVAQGGVYRPMAGKMPEEKLLVIGIALMFFGLAGLATVAWLAGEGHDPDRLKVLFYFACAVAVFGFAFVNPSITALVSKRSDPTRQGEALGVNQSFASLGRILGPLIGLILFFAGFAHTLPYFAGVLTLILVVMLLPRIKVRVGPHPSPHLRGGESTSPLPPGEGVGG